MESMELDEQTDEPQDNPDVTSLEGDLFGTLFGFHEQTMALLRQSSLGDDKLASVADRIEQLLADAIAEIERTKNRNLAGRLEAVYEKAQRMVDELSEQDTTRDQMEKIYGETPPADIPWNIESPPKALVELAESGQVQPCKTIDMGCGAGNYAIYLASVGFDVTGMDISPSAIALAEANAKKKGVTCRFVVADVLGGLEEITETFEFAYDWSVLHHIFPEYRRQYVETVHRLMVPGGKYLSVCFSEKDTGFGGTGKERWTPINTVLYFSSEVELRDLFEPYFDLMTLETVQVEGKQEPHLMNWAFMKKK